VALPIDPAAAERYNLSPVAARFLNLAVAIPFSGIWLIAWYGFSHLRSYARRIRNTKEGPAFQSIAQGTKILVFSLPITAVMSAFLNYLAIQDANFEPISTILRNYVRLLLPFISFMYISRGASMLLKTVKHPRGVQYPRFSTIGLIILSTTFTWLIINRPSTVDGLGAAYFMPDWLILSTIAVPYLYMWTRGLYAAYQITMYKKYVKGSVYKFFLSYLSRGFTTIILVSVLMQFILTVSSRILRLNLTPILLIVYVLVFLSSIGYIYIARGAKRLNSIEDV